MLSVVGERDLGSHIYFVGSEKQNPVSVVDALIV